MKKKMTTKKIQKKSNKVNLNITIDKYLVDAMKVIANVKGWSVSYTVNLSLEAVFKEVYRDYIKQWEAEYEANNTKEAVK